MGNLASYERDDPSFIQDLRDSRRAVAVAASWLSSLGYPVIVRPTFERPSVEQMSEYSDNGDLEIVQRIEVKRRLSLTFSSKADFPYETIIVDACHCFDRAHPKPYAYIILNREMTAACVVDVKGTRAHWNQVRKMDTKKARQREFYECPVALASFVDMSGACRQCRS